MSNQLKPVQPGRVRTPIVIEKPTDSEMRKAKIMGTLNGHKVERITRDMHLQEISTAGKIFNHKSV